MFHKGWGGVEYLIYLLYIQSFYPNLVDRYTTRMIDSAQRRVIGNNKKVRSKNEFKTKIKGGTKILGI